MYIAYACDCQDWVIPLEYNKIHNQNYGDRKGLGDDYLEFDLDKYGFYIEPIIPELEIDVSILVSGNRVRFVGAESSELRLPENADFMDPFPPIGKVLRYHSYEVIEPYQSWKD